MGLRVARMITKQLEKDGAKPTLLDPLEVGAPLLAQPLHFMKDQSQAPQWMMDTHKIIQDSQGFVIVTPEYNCSLPPALTNLLDHFPLPSFRHKPASIATYSMGMLGGARAYTVLRPFLSELGMVSLPSIVVIPTIQNAKIGEEGDVEDNERVANNTDKMCKELLWYIEALKAQSEKTGGNPN